tara:strand:+ start:2054 stop:2290 length:237 start_codon:yes stop_codon:yes gene_type:complete
MEINLKDKVLIKKSDYQNMLRLLVKASFVIQNAYTKDGEELVHFDNRDEGTQLFIDISAVTRIFDEDTPVKFITAGGE